ncbi:MAG TPA: thiamine phosphate synthase [Acidobacteriaceae bacterium]|jgi:thiamine-phosphate pyrophosphorylase
MLRCAITDGTASGFVNSTQTERLQAQVRCCAADGVDLIQLREKHLEAGALFALAEAAMRVLRDIESRTKLLINGRADVAVAACAHGVHLTSHPDELTPQQVRTLYESAGVPSPVISISCHTGGDVARSLENGVDIILFGPVFEKRVGEKLVTEGVGLERLAEACTLAGPVPVLALGGVTAENASACLAAGASGIAAIRLFALEKR